SCFSSVTKPASPMREERRASWSCHLQPPLVQLHPAPGPQHGGHRNVIEHRLNRAVRIQQRRFTTKGIGGGQAHVLCHGGPVEVRGRGPTTGGPDRPLGDRDPEELV